MRRVRRKVAIRSNLREGKAQKTEVGLRVAAQPRGGITLVQTL